MFNQKTESVMNDIEKMKAEFAEKLRIAQLENDEMARNGGIPVSVNGESYRKNGKTALGLGGILKGLSTKQVHDILQTYPWTEDIDTHVGTSGYTKLPYDMYVLNGPNQTDRLAVNYISGDYEISFYMKIDTQDPDVMQFFDRKTRHLSDSEFSTYYKVKTRWNKDAIERFPYLTFNCGHVVKFQGGADKQIAPGILTSIMETIKWKEFAD